MDPDDHTKDVKKGSRIIRIPLPNLYVLVLSLRRLTPSEGNTGILRLEPIVIFRLRAGEGGIWVSGGSHGFQAERKGNQSLPAEFKV